MKNLWKFLRQRTSQTERSYLKHLYSIASADGHVDECELAYISKIGKALNLAEDEIEAIKREGEQSTKATLPTVKGGRFFMLFSLINIILADDEIHPEELRITENIVMQMGYDPSTVNTILETIQYNQNNGIPAEDTYEHLKKYLA